jgi:cell fate regulator YaaT (PSP1 superfamily)
MAKEQNLPLNPAKISGVCGRLLCCLDYEYEQYREQKAKMPREGDQVDTSMGKATVIGGKPLEEKVKVELASGEKTELPLAEINVDKKASPRTNQSGGGRPPRRRRRRA